MPYIDKHAKTGLNSCIGDEAAHTGSGASFADSVNTGPLADISVGSRAPLSKS